MNWVQATEGRVLWYCLLNRVTNTLGLIKYVKFVKPLASQVGLCSIWFLFCQMSQASVCLHSPVCFSWRNDACSLILPTCSFWTGALDHSCSTNGTLKVVVYCSRFCSHSCVALQTEHSYCLHVTGWLTASTVFVPLTHYFVFHALYYFYG